MSPELYGIVEPDYVEQGNMPSPIKIVFPRAAASDANSAIEQLFEVFPDHEPSLSSEMEAYWTFQLNWTSDPHTFVDSGVSSTAESLYGLSRSEIGGFRELHHWGNCDVVISMVHSWALLAPARAISRRGNYPLPWIVHVDDHTDLMALMLEPLSRSGSLQDHIFEEALDLGNPDSVVAAVTRGVISKGNFLTAYLLAYPGCRAIHVGRQLTEQEFRLSQRTEAVEVGGRRFEQNGFLLEPSSIQEPWTFRQTRSLPLDLPVKEQEGVWLDIDLDYFCNRYNGDSDRRLEVALPGERDDVIQRVDQFLERLNGAAWLEKVEAVSVAVSPGFFPAEYWAEVIEKVCYWISCKLGA
jgi:hypothetical protein